MKLNSVLNEGVMTVKDAAKKVAQNLVDRYGYYTDQKPVVRQVDNDTYSVSWDGPTDWATNDTYWFHEEIADMMSEFGGDTSYDSSKYKPFYDQIPGFYMEPYSGYELRIYKD